MQAERTALSTTAVKREIRRIVAQRGHKLGSFDRYGTAECAHCTALMAEHDAREHLETGEDTLGCFDLACPRDDPAELILWFARLLREGEAVCVPGLDVWVARTKTGLRAGFGWTSLSWPRGDAEQMVREHVAVMLDSRRVGYFASRYRSEFALWRSKPMAFRITGVGRTLPRVDPDSARRLA